MARAGSQRFRQSGSPGEIKDYYNQYIKPVAKTWDEPKGFSGQIAFNAANGKFLRERE